MKATVTPQAMAAACKLTAAAAPTRPTLPVLAGALLTPSDDGLKVSTFDLDTSVEVVVRTDVVLSGDPLLVSHRLLTQVFSVAGAKPVDLVDDGAKLLARSGRSEWRMPTMPVQDYPKLPPLPDPIGVVDADLFAETVRGVALAASADDTLPMLTGVRVEFDGDQLTVAGTDRYRLHTATIAWRPSTDAVLDPVLVPARTLRVLAGFADGDVHLFLDGNLFAATNGNARFTTRLLEYQFPAYRSLLRARHDSTTTAVLDPASLADAVRQTSVGAGVKVPLRVHLLPGRGIGLEARDDEGNVVGVGAVDADVDGDEVLTALNPAYLLDAASLFTDRVELQLSAATHPVGFADPGVDAGSVVMPVRVLG